MCLKAQSLVQLAPKIVLFTLLHLPVHLPISYHGVSVSFELLAGKRDLRLEIKRMFLAYMLKQ